MAARGRSQRAIEHAPSVRQRPQQPRINATAQTNVEEHTLALGEKAVNSSLSLFLITFCFNVVGTNQCERIAKYTMKEEQSNRVIHSQVCFVQDLTHVNGKFAEIDLIYL